MRRLVPLLLHPKRLLTLAAGLLVAAAYVWVAAVRAVPGVRRRKQASRRARRARG